jgi:hypothetical protein
MISLHCGAWYRKIALCMPLMSLVAAASASKERLLAYDTYNNLKYHYAVDFPHGILIPQGESDAGDGQVFVSRQDSAKMTVYGEYNVLNQSPTTLYHDAIHSTSSEHPGRVMTYKHLGRAGFVISGHDGTHIFYEKLTMRHERVLTLLLDYPTRRRGLYDPMTKHIAHSLQLLP